MQNLLESVKADTLKLDVGQCFCYCLLQKSTINSLFLGEKKALTPLIDSL